MAWVYEQKFNDLNDGDLNGQDSWSGATSFDVQTTTKFEGTKALADLAGSGDRSIVRAGMNCSSGVVYIAMNIHGYGVRGSAQLTVFKDSAGKQCFEIQLRYPDGTEDIGLYVVGNPLYLLTTVTVDTWYIIAAEWEKDHGGAGVHMVRFKWKVSGGTYSAWTDWYNDSLATDGTIDSLGLRLTDSDYFGWWDTITPTDPAPDAPPAAAHRFFQMF